MSKVHSFADKKAFEAATKAFAVALWHVWFGPDAQIKSEERIEQQLRGIDQVISPVPWLPDYQFTGEDKVRDRSLGDVFLEFLSNDQRNVPGWAVYCMADLVLYAFFPSGRAYLLPMQAVRGIMLQRGMRGQLYRHIVPPAKNPGYRAFGFAVPAEILCPMIDEERLLFPCFSCGDLIRWSALRGGRPVAGCVRCNPHGVSPWDIRLTDQQLHTFRVPEPAPPAQLDHTLDLRTGHRASDVLGVAARTVPTALLAHWPLLVGSVAPGHFEWVCPGSQQRIEKPDLRPVDPRRDRR
jgi:hypothetical protein